MAAGGRRARGRGGALTLAGLAWSVACSPGGSAAPSDLGSGGADGGADAREASDGAPPGPDLNGGDDASSPDASGAGGGPPGCPALERVSVSSAGGQGSDHASSAALSADGRFVAFTSHAPDLVPNDRNATWDVFVFDRSTRTTERVSVSSAGAEANGPSGNYPTDEPIAISDDGRYVAFGSRASNLVPDDTNGAIDVFVHDRATHRTVRASLSDAGGQADGSSLGGVTMSGSGRHVAFHTNGHFVADDTNGWEDVFVRDLVAGTTTRVVGPEGVQGDAATRFAALSGDGTFVAVSSAARTFGGPGLFGFTPGTAAFDVLLDEGSASVERPTVDATGRFVAFSTARTLVAADTNEWPDVYRLDRATREVVLVSERTIEAAHPGSVDATGQRIGYWSGSFKVFDAADGSTFVASKALDGAFAVVLGGRLSRDGHCVVFVSQASNLVPGDTNGKTDVFVGPAR